MMTKTRLRWHMLIWALITLYAGIVIGFSIAYHDAIVLLAATTCGIFGFASWGAAKERLERHM